MLNLGRKEQGLIIIVAAIVLFVAGYQYAQRSQPAVELTNAGGQPEQAGDNGPVVHVVGAVEKPGLYKLPPGSRVNDALVRAVPLPEADVGALNLAEPLKDGRKLVVPLRQEQQQAALQTAPSSHQTAVAAGLSQPSGAPVSSSGGLVNINTAGVAELDTLPGIGPALAERIIQYRQANGPFQTIEDLQNVSGIGEKKYAQLQHKITVR
ncbi:helix-hairpin-helix domain-containing protein [Desulforamulus hydrothermalis]|uniref:Competence protein ComEA helix-hairpin-helix repeat protein n=1 Tax=Desulforamulus hydrothermalis Lam5 = DSM 18033 TaxID=1121428 RepID=K8DYP8_9FIRM|nr:helix-hairpin-helix domain-containing protein [Desulforamulus hydrothermalis]CCO07900.1 Competence protein ComEA helix-hairpin-helix repeat protein [Desulforamulus hydrothermalis Lam5 = DSM 18033]SHH35006.1 competence protein ComEA [Desulforamulus hydrothermalis Lam5 = DSM 18033]